MKLCITIEYTRLGSHGAIDRVKNDPRTGEDVSEFFFHSEKRRFTRTASDNTITTGVASRDSQLV